MDEREMGSQPPVIILDHFSFTLTFVSWVDRGSFPTVYPPGVEGFEVLFEAEADATRNADP